MKHKFSSMGRVAIALVLALSLSLVMAVPVAAIAEVEYTLEVDGDGTAGWSTEVTPPSGNYSVKLGVPLSYTVDDKARVEIPVTGLTLSDISTISYRYYVDPETEETPIGAIANCYVKQDPYASPLFVDFTTYVTYGTPYLTIVLDADHDGIKETYVNAPKCATDTNAAVWQLDTIETTDEPFAVKGAYAASTGWVWYEDWGTLSEIVSLIETIDGIEYTLGDADVLEVRLSVGSWAPAQPPPSIAGGPWGPVTSYVDDLEINGITYDLEPIFLDAEYYSTGDPATVTVSNGNEAGSGQVQVSLESELTGHITNIWADEKSGNPGVFEGSFTLVDSWTGVNQLMVLDGDTVTATYEGDWGAGSQPVSVEAGVDDIDPVVAITAPAEDVDFVSEVVEITATVTETNAGTAVLTIGGTEVVAAYTYNGGVGTVTYIWDTKTTLPETTYPEGALWPDGSYTIEVVATDLAGNEGSNSIHVTVDNTDPVITVQEATPPVVEPDVPSTIVFNATVTDATSGVESVSINLDAIGGDSDVEMLVDGDGDGIYTAEITTTLTEQDDPYILPVTATDLAGLSDTKDITLVCSSDVDSPVITDEDITYPVGAVSARIGDPVVVSAVVIDDGELATVILSCDTAVFSRSGCPGHLIAAMTAEEDSALYEVEFDVATETIADSYELTITATDDKGNEATETVTMVVADSLTGYNIDLVEGWNLVSLPLIPDVEATETVLASIADEVHIIWGYDPVNSPDDPWAYCMPGVIEGDLTNMGDGMGYWVLMLDSATLTISGVEMPELNEGVPPTPPTYEVAAGWNLIGVKNVAPEGIALDFYLGNLYDADIPEFSVIWGYDTEAGYFNVFPIGTVNLLPCQGYWLWMKVTGIVVPPQ